MLYFVYELVDPRTDEVRYVGITANPNLRLYQHVQGYKTTGIKRAWLQELRDAAVKPVMRILEKVKTQEEAEKRERHWIRKYIEQGYNLVNVQYSQMSDRPRTETRARRTAISVNPNARDAILTQRIVNKSWHSPVAAPTSCPDKRTWGTIGKIAMPGGRFHAWKEASTSRANS